MNEDTFYAHVKEQFSKLPPLRKSAMIIYDQAMGFYHAVSWSKEPWLQALLVLHLILLLLVVFGRRRFYLQSGIFFVCSAMVFAAESINKIASERWKEFSTQNYFDSRGVFMGTVFSGPILVILFVQLLLTLGSASRLVIAVKRHELGVDKKGKEKEKTS